MTKAAAPMGFSGWKIVVRCALAQNLATGLVFGSFGPMLASTEQHFGVSRTAATFGMSVTTATMGISSPLLGSVMGRFPVRMSMVFGALLGALGFAGLALLPSFALALSMYALIGAGVCLLSILGPVTMVNRWFVAGRGKMLGIINLPITVFLLPFILAVALPLWGRSALLLAMAAAFLLLIPLLLTMAETPGQIGERPWGEAAGARAGGATLAVRARQPASRILRMPEFWLLSLGVGVVTGTTTAFVVHIVPYGAHNGLSPEASAALMSIYAGSGLVGALLLGWIVDRLGGAATLGITALLQAGLWIVIPQTSGYALFLAAAVLGIVAVPINVLHQSALSELIEPAEIGRALGISYALKLPFIFAFAPLASFLFESSGGYHIPFWTMGSALFVAVFLFAAAYFVTRCEGATPTEQAI
ncbi:MULTISPECIES: MFS transporter [unclassified Sphingomonas]|uniref:MFS transporter n=1 Tax=unclassified Sphingomonas TaxID=196159 RepID=UPI00138EDF98|nr:MULTISPECIES: MFS transporter [unclassified Sphingomonas]